MSSTSTIGVLDVVGNLTLRRKLLIIILFGFFIRLYVVVNAVTISNDSVTFLLMAERFSAGDFAAVFNVIRPPLYPLLTSFTSTVFGDIELSARIVSLVFGTLVIPVSYGIGRMVYNEKTAVAAAVFAAIHPYMVRFSGEALTEGLYYFLTACVVYFGLKAVFEKRPSLMLAAGVFTAFAYLTKPAAIGFLIVISFISIIYDLKSFKYDWKKRFMYLVFAWVIFVALGLPYLYYLYSSTGGVAITGKFVATLFSSKASVTVGGNLSAFLSHFPESFSWCFVPLLIYGLAVRFRKGFTSKEYMVFVLLLAWWAVFYASTPSRKYMVQLMPVALIIPAVGLVSLLEFIKDRFRGRGSALVLCVFVVIFAVQMSQGMVSLHEHRHLERRAGLWMKANMGEGIPVVNRKRIMAFYGKGPYVRMRQFATFRKVVRYVRIDKAEYIAGYPSKFEKIYSDFKEVEKSSLEEVKVFEHDGRRFVIYRTLAEPGEL